MDQGEGQGPAGAEGGAEGRTTPKEQDHTQWAEVAPADRGLQKPGVRVDQGEGQGPAGAEGGAEGPCPHHTQWSGVAQLIEGSAQGTPHFLVASVTYYLGPIENFDPWQRKSCEGSDKGGGFDSTTGTSPKSRPGKPCNLAQPLVSLEKIWEIPFL